METIKNDCVICNEETPLEKLKSWENEMMQKDGWYAHFVPNPLNQNLVNAHTHGLVETYKHLDLQITLTLHPSLISHIFENAIKKIKTGIIFEDNQIMSDIIEEYNVKFIKCFEGGRDILRIIFPDDTGSLDRFTSKTPFNLQYDNTGIIV